MQSNIVDDTPPTIAKLAKLVFLFPHNNRINRSGLRVWFCTHYLFSDSVILGRYAALETSVKRLPYGITGFHYYLDPPPPNTDEETFIALAHSFAQLIGAQVTLTHRIVSAPERNFTAIEFKTENEAFATLMNGHYPLIAFSQPIQFDSLAIKFIDRPEFGKRWQELGEFQTLTMDELAISPYDVDVSDISDTEYDQILIHKPSTIGEIVFNFWD